MPLLRSNTMMHVVPEKKSRGAPNFRNRDRPQAADLRKAFWLFVSMRVVCLFPAESRRGALP